MLTVQRLTAKSQEWKGGDHTLTFPFINLDLRSPQASRTLARATPSHVVPTGTMRRGVPMVTTF